MLKVKHALNSVTSQFREIKPYRTYLGFRQKDREKRDLKKEREREKDGVDRIVIVNQFANIGHFCTFLESHTQKSYTETPLSHTHTHKKKI